MGDSESLVLTSMTLVTNNGTSVFTNTTNTSSFSAGGGSASNSYQFNGAGEKKLPGNSKNSSSSKEASHSSDKSGSPEFLPSKYEVALGKDAIENYHLDDMPSASGANCSPPFDNSLSPAALFDHRLRPGEYVMRILFSEFTAQAEKKIEMVMAEPPERQLSKSLQRGEDPAFDQLLVSIGSVSEHCLPSVLRTLFAWYDRQSVTWLGMPMVCSSLSSSTGGSLSSNLEAIEREHISLDPLVIERRDMAVEFIFCLLLIEVLKQIGFHPGQQDLVGKIEDLSFAHFRYREGTGPNAANGLIIADLYAEVLGVLAQFRFPSVRARFMSELAELRAKDVTTSVAQSTVSLLMGMKFFRVKMAPIEDFEAALQFLTECAKYFLEVKQRDIKHALAGLFVEILVPVAAAVKHEVNVPCLKSFVEMLYSPTLDMCTRSKHRLALFPLVTCLLCVSQKPFFLNNWHSFLAMCLSQLKSREPKMSRVALESLYRLLWAYMIRIKCESNNVTDSRLLSVVNSLFPRGSKGVVPRDTPLNIFVKIIQFIAQERLDFAMREIVFELLSVYRPIKLILTPERMNIGLRAFLVAADSLQQKDGDPPMPQSAGTMPSGNTLLRVKKTFLNKVLTDDAAKSIGMASYFPLIRKVFTDILRALDLQCGRPLLSITIKEQEESLLTGDRKSKIDLFRTCIAAIPRIIPDGMSRTELLSLLSRLTLHIDEELRGLSFQSLQCLLIDFPDWRNDVLSEFIAFSSKEVPDTSPHQLDNILRMLLQLLTSWRNCVAPSEDKNVSLNRHDKKAATDDGNERVTVTAASTVNSAKVPLVGPPRHGKTSSAPQFSSSGTQISKTTKPISPNLQTLYQAEGLGLLMLCSLRSTSRRLGAHILKEIKNLSDTIVLAEPPVLDVLDKICPSVCEHVSNMLPASEKQAIIGAIASSSLDLQWLTDRSCPAWYTQDEDNTPPNSHASTSTTTLSTTMVDVKIKNDPWALCLKEFIAFGNVPAKCPRAILEFWAILMPKVNALYTYLDPAPIADNRASLLRSAATPRKPPLDRNFYFKLWRNYLLFAFRTAPPNNTSLRCMSPEVGMGISSSPEAPDSRDGRSPLPLSGSTVYSVTPNSLYKLILPLIRSEANDVRDVAVQSLGLINHMAVKDMFEEFSAYLREACDRKQENVRRRKRKDNLRLQVVRVLKLIAKETTFGQFASITNHSYSGQESNATLPHSFIEFLESCKGWLETDCDREGGIDTRLQFCKTITYLLAGFEIELRESLLRKDVRKQLFHLCISWAGPYSHLFALNTSMNSISSNGSVNGSQSLLSKLEFSALVAAANLLTCGSCFQSSLLQEDSHLYTWIDQLLSSTDPSVYDLGEKVIILLLEFNPDLGPVLDWAVSRCFTGSAQIGAACFRAIATLFSAKEYPCDRYIAIINTTLLYTGSASAELQQIAFRLLQVLDCRFFGGLPSFHLNHLGSYNDAHNKVASTLDAVLSKTGYAKSQTFLSKQLSHIHPELTMPMFSEISWRMKSARSDVRQSLLRYMQPWLHNIELVEPAIPSANVMTPLSSLHPDSSAALSSSSCSLCGRKYIENGDRIVKRGWGSTEATEMVLNNLLYLTAKFGQEHEREVEECWQTLCCLSLNNQRAVLYYLLIVTGLAPNEILPHAKRVLIYLFRSRPVKLLEDLMAELQTVESLNWLVERTETPPFYRLSHLRKTSSYSDTQQANGNISNNNQPQNAPVCSQLRLNTSELEKGTIHTKRRSAEESTVFQQPHLRSSSSGTANLFRTEKARTISGPAALPDSQFLATEREKIRAALYESNSGHVEETKELLLEQHQYPSSETIAAGVHDLVANNSNTSVSAAGDETMIGDHETNFKLLPLPMPEYGGYYAPLREFFPVQPVSAFHRCNLALMFASEFVNEGVSISFSTTDHKKESKFDWCSHYLPLMIHMAVLGLDNSKPLVYQHCYNILINLLTVAGAHNNHLSISKLLLSQQTKDSNIGIGIPPLTLPSFNFLDSEAAIEEAAVNVKVSSEEVNSTGPTPNHSPRAESPRTPSKRNHSPANLLLVLPDDSSTIRRSLTISEMTLALIKFLAENKSQPLWPCEDITARLWNIRSASQLFTFLKNSLQIFKNSFPGSNLEKKWGQAALQIGLACSSRHYAGRSLQVYRALKVPLVSRTLCDILSRLVETVSETGDDMQGYVTELILTLITCVEAIPIQESRENMSEGSCSDDIIEPASSFKTGSPRGLDLSPPQMRTRSGTETELKRPSELCRSRSAQSLNGILHYDGLGDQDSLDRTIGGDNTEVIPQVLWLGLSLLESDYEHEYLLALRLLDKVTDRLPLHRLDCRDKIERIQTQLQWSTYTGVVPLLLKGCLNQNTYEQSLHMLCRFIPGMEFGFVDPNGESAFPLTVIAFMPYLLTHYEDPPPMCLEAAQLIAEVAAVKGDNGAQPMHHLATVMTLYSRRSFNKESVQWNKCIIKYLYDSYGHIAPLLLGLILDLLEKGPPLIQPAVLCSLYCSFNYVDLTAIGSLSSELLRAIQGHLEGPQWKDALRILKLVVTRSSTLVAPPPQGQASTTTGSYGPSSTSWDSVSTASSAAYAADIEFHWRKELPGRTMEFNFDVSQTPVIGRKHVNENNTRLTTGGLQQRSSSVGEMNSANTIGIIQTSWKKPWTCQSRVRECLINVLNACGQRVGLPKSPSVIFSQSSELLERQSSMASSTEDISGGINDASGASRLDDGSASDAHFRVFRDFDFLEYELESVDGDSSDNFNWGVRRLPLSEMGGTEGEAEGDADNETLMSTTPSHSHSQSVSQSISSDATIIQSSNNFSPRRPPDALPIEVQDRYPENQNQEESSDEDDLGLSPLDEVVPQLQGLISDPPTPQPHSLTLLDMASSQMSSPARSRRLSDTSLDSRSDDETTTPSNISPKPHSQGDLYSTEGDQDDLENSCSESCGKPENQEEQFGASSSSAMESSSGEKIDKPSVELLFNDEENLV